MQNQVLMKVDFRNRGTKLLSELRYYGNSGMGRQLVELIEDESLWTDEKQQRLMTHHEFKGALKTWESLQTLRIIEEVKNIDMIWNTRNIERIISALLHNSYISLETQDIKKIIEDEFLNFNFCLSGVSLFCSIVKRNETIKVSSNVDIEINGKGLDYAYENIDMECPTFCLLYMKAGEVATSL